MKSGKWRAEHGLPSKNPKGIHVSYCHVPTQYYWQMYDDYIKNPGFGALNPVVRGAFRKMVRKLRKLDYAAAQVPDYFVTISEYAKSLFEKYYGREAVVIHPPVEVDVFGDLNGASRDRGSSRPSSLGSDPFILGRDLRTSLRLPEPKLHHTSRVHQTAGGHAVSSE